MKTTHNSLRIAHSVLATILLAAAFCPSAVAQNHFPPGFMPGRSMPGRPMLPFRPTPVVEGNYLGPDAIAASRDGKMLYVTLADARQLALFDVAGGKIARSVALPAEPTALLLSPDGTRLYVTCAAVEEHGRGDRCRSGQDRRFDPRRPHCPWRGRHAGRQAVVRLQSFQQRCLRDRDRRPQADRAGGGDPRALRGRGHARRQVGLRGQSPSAGSGR